MHFCRNIVLLGALAAFAGAIPAPAPAQSNATSVEPSADVKSFVKDLGLTGSEEKEALQALGAQDDDLRSGPTAQRASQDGYGPSSSDGTRAALACQISRLVFARRNHYFDPSSQLYTTRSQVHWSQLCWLSPKCIVTPGDAASVAVVLKIVTFLNARFAVRSGGHNPNPGFANVPEYGVLIDLSNLNQLELSADKSFLKVGTGNRWGMVYEYLKPNGRLVIGGRVPEVGVGGLLIGAGLHTFANAYGLPCDNVKNYEIVLANSTVINVNIAENPDLFSALKGGGPNFGIVTRFDLYTVPIDQIWFEVLSFAPSETEKIMQATVEWQAAAEEDSKAGLVTNFGRDGNLVGMIYGEPTLRPPIFDQFYAIPSVATVAPSQTGAFIELARVFTSANTPPGANWDVVGYSTGNDAELYQQGYERFLEIARRLYNETGGDANLAMGFQPIATSVVEQGVAKGGNPLGLGAQPQEWFYGVVSWFDERHNAAAHEAVTRVGEVFMELAGAKGLALPYVFMNDATYSQNPLASYGAANVARLRDVSRRYDPAQVFQRLQNDGFLLSKA